MFFFSNSLIHPTHLHRTKVATDGIEDSYCFNIYKEIFAKIFKILSTQNYTTSRITIWLQSRTCLNLCWSIQGSFLLCTTYLISQYAQLAAISLAKIFLMTNFGQVMFIATWTIAITYWFQLLLYPSRYFSHTIMLFNTIYSSLTATIGTVWLLSLLYIDNNIHFGFVAFVLILFVGSVYILTARTFLIWKGLSGKNAATTIEERQDQEEMRKRLSQLNPFSSEV